MTVCRIEVDYRTLFGYGNIKQPFFRLIEVEYDAFSGTYKDSVSKDWICNDVKHLKNTLKKYNITYNQSNFNECIKIFKRG